MDSLVYLAWSQSPLFEQMLALGAWAITIGIVVGLAGYILLERRNHES